MASVRRLRTVPSRYLQEKGSSGNITVHIYRNGDPSSAVSSVQFSRDQRSSDASALARIAESVQLGRSVSLQTGRTAHKWVVVMVV